MAGTLHGEVFGVRFAVAFRPIVKRVHPDRAAAGAATPEAAPPDIDAVLGKIRIVVVVCWSLRIFRMNSGIFQQVKTMRFADERKCHA